MATFGSQARQAPELMHLVEDAPEDSLSTFLSRERKRPRAKRGLARSNSAEVATFMPIDVHAFQ